MPVQTPLIPADSRTGAKRVSKRLVGFRLTRILHALLYESVRALSRTRRNNAVGESL